MQECGNPAAKLRGRKGIRHKMNMWVPFIIVLHQAPVQEGEEPAVTASKI